MKTILLSTSCLWNCGDDFIRDGVLALLNLRPDVRTIWWNRALGVRSAFANDLKVNVRHCDYFIVAGTPSWMNRTEYIYRHCLEHRIPVALIGVGTRGGMWNPWQKRLLRQLAASDLVEVCLVRDKYAFETLQAYGFRDVKLIMDPAFFVTPGRSENRVNLLGYRDYAVREKVSWRDYGKTVVDCLCGRQRQKRAFITWYDHFMQGIFDQLPDPKRVVVHDNREIARAEQLFGRESVFYATDYREIFRMYSTARTYIGSRIHGAIPSILHGACANVLYLGSKAHVVENSTDILSRRVPGIADSVHVVYIEDRDAEFPQCCVHAMPDGDAIRTAIAEQKKVIQEELRRAPRLSAYLQ